MGRQYLLYVLLASLCPTSSLLAQVHYFDHVRSSEQLEVSPPPVRRADPPSGDAAVAELEERGDTLRAEKSYLDALDYYRAALAKEPNSARIYNKIGINELQMARFNDARKDFERAIKNDRQFADAYNNLGVIYYLQKSTALPSSATRTPSNCARIPGRITATLGRHTFPKRTM